MQQTKSSSQSKSQTVFSIFSKETLKHSWLFLVSLLGVAIMQASELTSPLYLKQFFNTIVIQSPDAAVFHGLLLTLVIIGALYVIDWAGNRLMSFSTVILEAKVVSDLYAVAFEYLIDHSYQFFSSQFSGTLTRRVSKFATSYESLFDSIILQFLPTGIFVTGAVIILFIRNHVLGSALGIWAVLFLIFQYYVAKYQRPLRERSSIEDSKLTGGLADAISNQTTIGLFSGNIFERARFLSAVTSWKKITLTSWKSNEYIWGAMGFFVVIINIGLLFGALYYWQRGLLTVGDFVLIQSYLLSTVQQLYGINRNLRRFYESNSDANEMVSILNTPHDVQDMPNAGTLHVKEGAIDFRDVSFYFHENRSILTNFNLNIQGGQKVALVGPSGAGKSTVTKLLLRFYDVKSGAITIDGQTISEVTQNSLRDAIAFVPQEPILFHRSLMENIRYGRRYATDAEVIEAAKKANCHDFIMGFPEKYETFVGERGVKLSGGERQRVAIARAILKDAPILILDEATSSLDSESESLIQSALDVLMEGKTVMTIAHRLSTIMKMDRIIVLDTGKIVADGTHTKLLEEGGLYKKLWSIQAGGFMTDEGEETEEQTEL